MRYLYYFKGTNNPKNKLEEEVYAYLQAGDRLPVNADDFPRLKNAMLYQVECFNKKYPRCKPVVVKFKDLNNGDVAVFVGCGDTSPFHGTFLKFVN